MTSEPPTLQLQVLVTGASFVDTSCFLPIHINVPTKTKATTFKILVKELRKGPDFLAWVEHGCTTKSRNEKDRVTLQIELLQTPNTGMLGEI